MMCPRQHDGNPTTPPIHHASTHDIRADELPHWRLIGVPPPPRLEVEITFRCDNATTIILHLRVIHHLHWPARQSKMSSSEQRDRSKLSLTTLCTSLDNCTVHRIAYHHAEREQISYTMDKVEGTPISTTSLKCWHYHTSSQYKLGGTSPYQCKAQQSTYEVVVVPVVYLLCDCAIAQTTWLIHKLANFTNIGYPWWVDSGGIFSSSTTWAEDHHYCCTFGIGRLLRSPWTWYWMQPHFYELSSTK
jgi:hypothetical protein